MAVSIEEFGKALLSLREALEAYHKQNSQPLKLMLRDASIQRFEFCFELAWKTALKKLGLPAMAPKPAIREMAQAGLLANTNLWFDFIEARNKSSHTYDENIAREVMQALEKFLPEAEKLYTILKTK